MRFILKIGMILVGGLITGFFLPKWWSLCIIAALVGLLLSEVPRRRMYADKKKVNVGNSFLAGLIAGMLIWGLWALWKDIGNEMILSNRISALIFSKPVPYSMVLVSAFIGGLFTAFSAMTGAYLGILIKSGFSKRK